MKLSASTLSISLVLAVFAAILLASLSGLPGARAATTFDVGAVICDESWSCTNFTEDTCGTRTCLDAMACGTTFKKPTEYIECPITPSPTPTPTHGGGGGFGTSTMNITRRTAYTVSTEAIPISVTQSTTASKTVRITAASDQDITVQIISSPDSTGNLLISTTTTSLKLVKGASGEITIEVNATNVNAGTYMAELRLSSKDLQTRIPIIITVNEKETLLNFQIGTPQMTISADNQKLLESSVKFTGFIPARMNVTFTVLDSDGKTVGEKTIEGDFTKTDVLSARIMLPDSLQPGYHVLSVKAQTPDGYSVKSRQFTYIDTRLYTRVIEQPISQPSASSNSFILLILSIVAVIVSAVLAGMSSEYWAKRRKDDEKKKAKEKSGKMTGLPETLDTKEDSKKEKANRKEEKEEKKQEEKKEKEAHNKDAKMKETWKEKLKRKREEKALHRSFKLGFISKEMYEKFLAKRKSSKGMHENKAAEAAEDKISKEKEKERENILLKEAPSEYAFVLPDGHRLRSLKDLYDLLEGMPEDTFNHHTKEGRHDFANWTKDVFKEHEIAEKMKSANTRKELKKVLEEYMRK